MEGNSELLDEKYFQSEDEEAITFLQYMCSADIDKPVGSTVYTGMQNKLGGYVTDCTLSRIGPHQ